MQKFFIVALVALFCVSSIHGLKCYECLGQQDCENPKQIECKENIKGCASAAASLAPYVSRGCAQDGEGSDFGLDGCVETVFQGQKAKICECQSGDFCNDHNVQPPKNVINKTNVGRREMAAMAKAKEAWMNLAKKQ